MFEFAGAEDEVSGGDFVAESFADLGDAEGDFDAAGIDDVFEIGEDALGGFGAEIGGCGLIAESAQVGLEHQVKVSWRGEGAGFSGGWGGDFFVFLGEGLGIGLEVEGEEGALFGEFALEGFGLFFGFLEHRGAFEDGNVADEFALDFDFGEEELVGAVTELRFLAVDHGV